MFHYVHHEVKIWLESIQLLRRCACVKQSFGVNICLCIYLSRFLATVTSNSSPYTTGPLSCLHVCLYRLRNCGQTVSWIKRPLGTEVGLGPGVIVLDDNPAPPRKGEQQRFGPFLLWPNGRPSQQLLSSCFIVGATGHSFGPTLTLYGSSDVFSQPLATFLGLDDKD